MFQKRYIETIFLQLIHNMICNIKINIRRSAAVYRTGNSPDTCGNFYFVRNIVIEGNEIR